MGKHRLQIDLTTDEAQLLAEAMIDTLEDVCEEASTTPSEVVSAAFIVLDRLLRGARRLAPTEDRHPNADELNRVLYEFITDFGHIPS